MSKKRGSETEEGRQERVDRNAKQREDDRAAADDAIDAMVERNIQDHGP